ncbi:MAG: hypothetical protein M1440_02135 [Gammaproteobacteria bacterium]|nr:hypothetical protein [Gammaproteobacteria bacterium]
MNMFGSKPKPASSTPFSDFIRNASSGEKKRIYAKVIESATERQRCVIEAQAAKA